MNNHMMRRLLAMVLSALLMLGSCSIAETVPVDGAESTPVTQEAAVIEAAASDPGEGAAPNAEEPAASDAEPSGSSGDNASDSGMDAPDSTTVPDSTTEPDGTIEPDSTTEPDSATEPDGATEPDSTIEPDESKDDVQTAIEIEEIRLPEKIEIFSREEYQLVPELLPEGAQGKLSYRMDNPNVATVDENGLLRADMEGTSFVVVTAENGVSASCTVRTVHNPVGVIPVEEIVLPEEMRIVEGRSQMIHVKLLPEGAYEELAYSIADPGLAVVSENGWVDAIRPGTTELIVTSYTGKTARTPLIIEQEGAEYYEISDGVLTKYKGGAHYVNVPEGVTAIGSKAFSERTELWEVTLPASLQRIEYGAFSQCKNLEKVVMGDGVTSIGDYCFEDCYALRSVRLSASLTEIGKSAFEDCTSLSAIDLPASLRSIGATAFNRCSALKAIALPDVTYIGGGAFTNTAITELTVPGSLGKITTAFLPSNVETVKLCEGITAIEQWDFVQEQPIKWIELPYSLTSICNSFMVHYGSGVTVYGPGGGDVQAYFEKIGRKYVPYDDVTVTGDFRIEDNVLVEYTGKGGRVVIPEQVTKIGDNAFYGRSDVTEVVFHDGVTWIGYQAFLNCTGLTELNLPSKLERLEFYAFTGCTGLTHLEIPGSVKSFAGVFNRCTGLESVVIGEGVTACGSFEDCVNLKQVKLPSSLTRLYDNCFMGCTSLAEIQLPAGVTAIQGNCFRGCTSLTEIALPSGLQELGYGAFQNCTGLKSIKLPAKIRSIESSTFKGCSSLASVTLPEGLQSITGGSFAGCTSLKELYVPASVKEILYAEPPYINGPVFANCPNLTVYGMKGSAIQQYCVKAGVPFKVLDASAASISFPEGNLTLGVGQKYIPEIRVDSIAGLESVSFTSSSSRVTVNKTTGEIIAKRTGTATITAKSASGATASYKVTVKAAPGSISFKEKNPIVMVGEEFRLEYSLPANTAAGVTFREESFFVLRETSVPGVYLASDPGVAKVTVTTHNGKSDTCTVTVVPKPTAVYVDREEIVLRQTLSDVIVPSVNPESICKEYAFVSSDPEIVTVDENGKILGVSQGTAEITVSAPSVPGLQASCRVTVIAPPPQIVLAATKISLGVGEKYDLNVGYISDEPDYNPPYSCKSSNSKYVTVSADGVVTAKRAGTATITVTNADGMKATCAVTVKRAPSSVKISPANGNLAVGQTGAYKWTLSSGSAGSVRFESSDPAVLEVQNDGTAIAKAAGTAKVRVTTYNGKTATATVTVHPQPESVTFTKNGDPMRFAVGMKGTLRATLAPSNYGSYTIESSDPSVISVDAKTGAYAVHAMGECDLTVTAYNGVSETRHAKACVTPDAVKALDASLTLGVGDSREMRILCSTESGRECEPGFSYKSGNTRLATVDENGVITAKAAGSVTITATSFNGLKATCKVTVKAAPKSISLKQKSLTAVVGEEFRLGYSLPANTAASVAFRVEGGSVQETQEAGAYLATDPGVAKVTVTTHNGKSDTCTVTVVPKPTALYVDREEIVLRQTLSDVIVPSVNPESICKEYAFVSSDPEIVTVDENGKILGVSQGTAEITVSAPSVPGLQASCRVTVIAPPPQIVLAATKISLGVGEKYDLNVGYISDEPDYNPPYSCKSSNSKYVTVSADGVVTAKRAGTATITVTNADGMKATCAVTVKRAPSSVKISPANGNLAVGQTGAYKWTLSSGSAGSVRFESSDPAVLEVQNDGTAIAKAAGTAKVRVTTYNGKTATATVTVHPQPESVTFTKNGDPMRFAVGMKGTLRATLAPSNYGSYTIESSDPSVISVDAKTGAYAVHAMGECDLTVTAYNGVSETRHAKVYVAPNYVKAVDTQLTLGVGEAYAMRIYCEASYGQECEPGFSYKSSNTRLATVDENGVITAKASGTATITATSFNGFSVTCKVTVKKAPTSLKLSATELTLGQNESFQLSAKLSPSDSGGVVRYETSDFNLAFVDETGRIVANRHEGTVVITARTYNGLEQSCTVTLGREPTSIEFPVDSIELYVGMKLPIDVQINGGVCNSLSSTSSDSAVAYMDASGRIVAKKKGAAEIRVKSYNGCSDSIYVTVGSAPSACYLDLPGTLYVGYLYNLPNYFRTSPETNPWLTLDSATVSNDCAVILENETGLYLMPLEVGSFTVTVKSYNGRTVRKSFKAAESGQTIVPEISSPVRADAQLSEYSGSWKLTGVCTEGMTFPPEMFDLGNSSIIVHDDWTEVSFNGNQSYTYHRLDEGALLLLDETGEEALRCRLHENGMLSLPLAEDVVLWYQRM